VTNVNTGTTPLMSMMVKIIVEPASDSYALYRPASMGMRTAEGKAMASTARSFVGFSVGGFELGLIPDGEPGAAGVQAYWGVPDAAAASPPSPT
jgi:hypothetical protein